MWYAWLVVALGLVFGALGIAGTLIPASRGELFTLGLKFIIVGGAIGSLGLAEALPIHRRRLAGRLRIAALCGYTLFFGFLVVQVLSTGPQTRYYFGGIFAIIAAGIVAMWVAFKIWGENPRNGTDESG